jgi:general secretion pathway protein B
VSFILEALKRSENERQRQTGPGIAASPEGGGAQRRSPWLVVIGVLLLINVGVLGFLITRPGETPAPAATAPARATPADDRRQRTQPAPAEAVRDERPAAPAPAAPAAEARVLRPAEAVTEPAPAAMTAPRREVRSLSAEAADKPEAEAAPQPAGAPRVAAAVEEPAPRPAVTRPERAPPASVGENLPTVQELTLRGEFSGRPLHLELHVYYDDPSRRLVFINGSKYREGEQIDDDLRVDEIVPEGVVLHDGRQRFLLPST